MVLPSYIDHQPIDCGQEIVVRNPANLDHVVGTLGQAPLDLVDSAVRAAQNAFMQWRGWDPLKRAEVLRIVAQRIEEQQEVIAKTQTLEHGKVYQESLRNVHTTLRIIRYYADLAETFPWEWTEPSLRGPSLYTCDPIGVTAVIVPWNSPLTLGFLMVIPAILSGNTVVVKPASFSPLALGQALRILAEALPAGVVNWVTGDGRSVGMALASHPEVRRIAFTGSTETGRELMAVASQHIKNISLELGGNDPAIVLDDVVLNDQLFDRFVEGVFTSSGQICLNIKRIYVHTSVYDRFVDGFIRRVNQLVIGDPMDAGTTMGPVNNAKQFATIQALMEDARQKGGEIFELGQAASWVNTHQGYFMRPTVVTQVPDDAPLVLQEQFGPVIPILAYKSWEEVRDWANGTEYGLCSSIWTSDVERAWPLARQLEAGTTFFNVHRAGASDIDQAFGGVKQSGLGRGHGHWAIEEATELHTWIVGQ